MFTSEWGGFCLVLLDALAETTMENDEDVVEESFLYGIAEMKTKQNKMLNQYK